MHKVWQGAKFGARLENKESWTTQHNKAGGFLAWVAGGPQEVQEEWQPIWCWPSHQSFLEQGRPIFNFKLFTLLWCKHHWSPQTLLKFAMSTKPLGKCSVCVYMCMRVEIRVWALNSTSRSTQCKKRVHLHETSNINNSEHLLQAYYVPDTDQASACHAISLNAQFPLWGILLLSHSRAKRAEAQGI